MHWDGFFRPFYRDEKNTVLLTLLESVLQVQETPNLEAGLGEGQDGDDEMRPSQDEVSWTVSYGASFLKRFESQQWFNGNGSFIFHKVYALPTAVDTKWQWLNCSPRYSQIIFC